VWGFLQELPDSVQDLGASVKVLDASKNRIAQLPAWLGTLTNLQRLALESNKLVTLPPDITDLALLKV
jgi:Leucine-rich repeat (LRR) protein